MELADPLSWPYCGPFSVLFILHRYCHGTLVTHPGFGALPRASDLASFAAVALLEIFPITVSVAVHEPL